MLLRVCLFNILENGLAFGAIPWVMIIPAALQLESSNFDAVQGKLKTEYITHWHKNANVGPGYKNFRRMWGKHIQGPDDLLAPGLHSGPSGRPGGTGGATLRFASEDEVEYDCEDGRAAVRATTLRGMLMRELRSKNGDHAALAARVFDHIVKSDAQVFDWRLRGKAIFDLITNRLAASSYKGASSSAARFYGPAGLSPTDPLDVIVLCEYDVHLSNDEDCPQLDYLGDGVFRSFPDAMVAVGYHSLLLEGPKADDSGPAVFARAAMFDLPCLDEGQQQQQKCVEGGGEGPSVVKAAVATPHPSLASFDLLERHHAAKSGPHFSSDSSQMRLADRRNAGFVALNVKDQPGRRLVVVAAHLMTPSRDNSASCVYPGEVRAGELEKIKSLAQDFLEPTDVVLFVGDMNINIRGNRERHIFEGSIPLSAQAAAAQVDGAADALPALISFDTGVSVVNAGTEGEAMQLQWGCKDGSPIFLRDSFQGVNVMDTDTEGRVQGSSHNAVRIETIDYIWHSEQLKVLNRSSLVTTEDGIPDEENPSDHIPLFVTFSLDE